VGGTAIELKACKTDAIEVDLEEPGLGTAVALIVIVCAATLLAILPAAIALNAPGIAPGWMAGAAGTLAAAIAMGKLAAMTWAAGSRLWDLHLASVAAAYAD